MADNVSAAAAAGSALPQEEAAALLKQDTDGKWTKPVVYHSASHSQSLQIGQDRCQR
jgi:hypothetical protein